MPHQQSTILAIDPGSRKLGYAILDDKHLLFYGVKTVIPRRSPLGVLETVSKFIRSLINRYHPTDLAIEKTFVTQKNLALLTVVANQIKEIVKESGLPIFEYAPKTLRKRLCQTGKATKRETAKLIAERFPELKRYYERTMAWEIDHYANLFDAVAVGLVCREDLAENTVPDASKGSQVLF